MLKITQIVFFIIFIAIYAVVSEVPPNNTTTGESDKSDDKKTDPQKIEAAQEFYNIGLDAFKEKQYEKARDLFIKAISYDENFIEAYAKLGDTYQILKEEEFAYESYKKCIELIDKSGTPSDEMTKLREEIKRKTEKFRVIDEKISSLDNEFISSMTILS